MAEHRARHDWAQTSHVLALLYNVNRGASTPARAPADFNPYAPRRRAEADFKVDGKEGLGLLKQVFGKK